MSADNFSANKSTLPKRRFQLEFKPERILLQFNIETF